MRPSLFAPRSSHLMLAVLLAPMLAPPQQPVLTGPQTGRAITGRVVDGAGKPIAGVAVAVTGPNLWGLGSSLGSTRYAGPPQVLTAADGRFAFHHLPDGTFSVTADRNGYSEGAYGRRRPGGSSRFIALSGAQPSADITIVIWKSGVISGTLTDEAGEPVIGAELLLYVATFFSGVPRFDQMGLAFTDDRGKYRFSNLLPSDYLVGVTGRATPSGFDNTPPYGRARIGNRDALPGMPTAITVGDGIYAIGRGSIVPPPVIDGHLMVYAPTFYRSALAPANATVVTVATGEERAGIDIQVQPVVTARVAGTLVGPDGPVVGAAVQLRSSGFEDVSSENPQTASTDVAGRFVFSAVPIGEYTLRAGVTLPAGFWLNAPLSVSGDVDGFVATLRPGLKVTFRVEYQGTAVHPAASHDVQTAPFALEPADGTPPPGFILPGSGEGGRVTLGLLPGGKYFVRVRQSPQGWMFKSAVVNGVDVSETPFELTHDIPDLVITFTDQWSGLGGTVRDANGNPDASASVVVFPTTADAWRNYGATSRRLKSGSTNDRGEFSIASLPPGDYYVVAIPEDDPDDWRNPRMLDALARIATPVAILEGEHQTIELRTKEVPR